MDLSEKESESEIAASGRAAVVDESPDSGLIVKSCFDCGTTKTPLWRSGPAGPKSLCNACGIRSRKKRRGVIGLNKGESGGRTKKGPNGKSGSNKLGDSNSIRRRMLALGREVILQRSMTTTMEKQRKKLGEVEQAAVLLMALSYGSVYA